MVSLYQDDKCSVRRATRSLVQCPFSQRPGYWGDLTEEHIVGNHCRLRPRLVAFRNHVLLLLAKTVLCQLSLLDNVSVNPYLDKRASIVPASPFSSAATQPLDIFLTNSASAQELTSASLAPPSSTQRALARNLQRQQNQFANMAGFLC